MQREKKKPWANSNSILWPRFLVWFCINESTIFSIYHQCIWTLCIVVQGSVGNVVYIIPIRIMLNPSPSIIRLIIVYSCMWISFFSGFLRLFEWIFFFNWNAILSYSIIAQCCKCSHQLSPSMYCPCTNTASTLYVKEKEKTFSFHAIGYFFLLCIFKLNAFDAALI